MSAFSLAGETSAPGRGLALLRATGPAGIASAAVLAAVVIAAVFGPLLAPYDPNLPNLSLAWVGPVGGHLLGYDFEGRDVASRLLAGAQTALLGPLAVVVLSVPVGTLLAVTAAWRRAASSASRMAGKANKMLRPEEITASLAPRRQAAVTASSVPTGTLMTTTVSGPSIVVCAPPSSRDSTSRPSKSYPSR